MLFSASIGSQDTLKVVGDRLLIVNENQDTIFVYGEESHFIVEKMFEEKDLLVQEIINNYETFKGLEAKQYAKDSIIRAQENKIINLELSSKTRQSRLDECENSQELAELDINEANKTIKAQNKRISTLRMWNRVKNLVATSLVGVVIYLTFF